MLVAQLVNDWVSERRPKAVCDNCIVEGLKLTTQAHSSQITAALGTTSDFIRSKSECSICKNARLVIRAS
jgi:hypothetical protein